LFFFYIQVHFNEVSLLQINVVSIIQIKESIS
jgi:hypothetical protein